MYNDNGAHNYPNSRPFFDQKESHILAGTLMGSWSCILAPHLAAGNNWSQIRGSVVWEGGASVYSLGRLITLLIPASIIHWGAMLQGSVYIHLPCPCLHFHLQLFTFIYLLLFLICSLPAPRSLSVNTFSPLLLRSYLPSIHKKCTLGMFARSLTFTSDGSSGGTVMSLMMRCRAAFFRFTLIISNRQCLPYRTRCRCRAPGPMTLFKLLLRCTLQSPVNLCLMIDAGHCHLWPGCSWINPVMIPHFLPRGEGS